MSRLANPLTGTQKNSVQFERLKTQIKQIGVRMLGSYGLISHETINNYCRGLAVGQGSEDKIFLSIRAHEELEYIADQESLKKSTLLLGVEETCALVD